MQGSEINDQVQELFPPGYRYLNPCRFGQQDNPFADRHSWTKKKKNLARLALEPTFPQELKKHGHSLD